MKNNKRNVFLMYIITIVFLSFIVFFSVNFICDYLDNVNIDENVVESENIIIDDDGNNINNDFNDSNSGNNNNSDDDINSDNNSNNNYDNNADNDISTDNNADDNIDNNVNNNSNVVVYDEKMVLNINKYDGKIYNGYNEEVILKGLVMPNVDTVQFISAINKTTLKSLKDDLGVNMIRFTLSPLSTLDYGTALYRIKNAINNASELGIYIIINWGIMNDTIGDPRLTLSKNSFAGITTADNYFKTIAEYSKNNPYVMFEICNEPYVKSGTSKWENQNTWNAVKEYADIVIPIIRKYSNNIIIVAGKSGVVLTELTEDPITKYSNIAYTFHMYPYNYDFDIYKLQLDKAIDKKLTIIATETSIIDASLSEKNQNAYNIEKMNQYINYFKYKNYSFHFAYFKFSFPFESEEYNEWSILKPLHQNYYDTRCGWSLNKNLGSCLEKSVYVRHMSNLNLSNKLTSEYFCASDSNKCSSQKGKGVYSISGLYFVNNLMDKYN